jgi:hypothetical protein
MDISVQIRPAVIHDDLEVFILAYSGTQTNLLQAGDRGSPKWRQLGELEALPVPTFTLPGKMAGQILVALARAIEGHGIEPSSESRAKGQLEATIRHLEDMRAIVFKREPQS